jgi:Amt family ammonium transporter
VSFLFVLFYTDKISKLSLIMVVLKYLLGFIFLFLSGQSFAQSTTTAQIDTGDTAWMLVATCMVMLMTPAGLALFYGGLSSRKSVLNTVGMSYGAYCVASLVWVIIGYTLAFSGKHPLIGDLNLILLDDMLISDITGTIPSMLYVCFQGTFAAIAVAIVSGSVVERMKFSSWLVFSAIWVVLVYAPITHWVWGGGILSNNGELDFAGGTVIHVNAGIAGLVLSLLLGKRRSMHEGNGESTPSSLKLTVLGSALLWFGWFGFNGGSALAANGLAAHAFLVTNAAAAAGGIAWVVAELVGSKRPPSLLGISSGAISGLVGITPASGYVDVKGALAIGIVSGIIGYYGAMRLKHKLKYDDTLDAFGIHGLVGIWGSLATGLFANPHVNSVGTGMFYGNPIQLWVQTKIVLAVIVFSAIGTTAAYFITVAITRGARVHEEVEDQGLDAAYHREASFDLPLGNQ